VISFALLIFSLFSAFVTEKLVGFSFLPCAQQKILFLFYYDWFNVSSFLVCFCCQCFWFICYFKSFITHTQIYDSSQIWFMACIVYANAFWFAYIIIRNGYFMMQALCMNLHVSLVFPFCFIIFFFFRIFWFLNLLIEVSGLHSLRICILFSVCFIS